jgi:1-acyl-sn-glycerol-3-phosphate acyltransferase
MYPPIFREPSKRAVTRAGLDFLAGELSRSGVLAGMHPEGTRSRGVDPYELLAPEQSFGRVALKAKPTIVPVFVNGAGNSLWRECWDAVRGRAEPIVIVIGAPLELGALAASEPDRLRAQIDVGKCALAAIRELGAEERAYRSSLGQRP